MTEGLLANIQATAQRSKIVVERNIVGYDSQVQHTLAFDRERPGHQAEEVRVEGRERVGQVKAPDRDDCGYRVPASLFGCTPPRVQWSPIACVNSARTTLARPIR